MKPTYFHFPILYLRQRTFSFLEQRSCIKLPSLSLLVDTTRIATSLIRKNHKSSNINPHSFYLFLCLLFVDQILAPLPGRERLYCSILKFVFVFVCRRSTKELTITGSERGGQGHCARIHLPSKKIRVKASFSD